MRTHQVETPVKHPRRDERVYIPDGEQILAAGRDVDLAERDAVDEACERGREADYEGCDGAPVCGEARRVAVDAVEVVHCGDGDAAFAHDVVALNEC